MITDQDVTKLKKTFATKAELSTVSKKVDGIMYEVGDLKVEVCELKESVNSIHDKLDNFLGNYERLDLESKVCTVVQQRHAEQIAALAAHTGFILPA